MSQSSIDIDVCLALIRELLSGYRGYPPTRDGEMRFAMAVQESAVSVGHARAVLLSFEDFFPTVRQILDVASNLLSKFQVEPDRREQWRTQYGKPQPFLPYPADVMAMHWQAFRDMLFYTEGPGQSELASISDRKQREASLAFWESARIFDFDADRKHADTIAFVRELARSLGWPAVMAMDAAPASMPYQNPTRRTPRRVFGFPAVAPPAQIESASQDRKTPADVDRELDGWDDPDR